MTIRIWRGCTVVDEIEVDGPEETIDIDPVAGVVVLPEAWMVAR